MKKISIVLAILMIATFALFAMGSGEESGDTTADQGKDTVVENAADEETEQASGEEVAEESEDNSAIGDYSVVIDSCRLAKDYEGKDVVIVKYIFTNVSDDSAAAFMFVVEDAVYQNGVGLNDSLFVDDSANYSIDNQTKEIKQGASIEVEVAYELNDITTDIDVEVSEFISFDDKVITKTFVIAQ